MGTELLWSEEKSSAAETVPGRGVLTKEKVDSCGVNCKVAGAVYSEEGVNSGTGVYDTAYWFLEPGLYPRREGV